MNTVIMSFDPNEKQSVICERATRVDHCLVTLSGFARHILFCSCLCKVCSRASDTLSQALCNLSLTFLADFTLSDTFHINTQV